MSPWRLLALFAFYAAARDLGAARGLVASVASPVGLALLLGAGLLFAWRAVAAGRSPAPASLRAARVLLSGGACLVLLAVPASFATREARGLAVGEGEVVGLEPGAPPVRFGEVRLAPRGAHALSKTVTIEAFPAGEAPVEIGLFPPHALGSWRATIVRFGYAVGIVWLGREGRPVAEGFVKLGTLPHREEDAALVAWAPEPNVMMGAGTFPPKLEDLVSPPGADAHLFLRLEEATIAGVRRDLRDPDAHRWLVDGRLEDAVFFAQVFRGKERVFEGPLRAGGSVRFPGGALALEPRVLLWVDLLATRDPFLPWAGAGLLLLGLGLLLRAALAGLGLARRLAPRPPAA